MSLFRFFLQKFNDFNLWGVSERGICASPELEDSLQGSHAVYITIEVDPDDEDSQKG